MAVLAHELVVLVQRLVQGVYHQIQQLERYLSICKNRFEDRLSYDISVQAELREYLLPRFLLQPGGGCGR